MCASTYKSATCFLFLGTLLSATIIHIVRSRTEEKYSNTPEKENEVEDKKDTFDFYVISMSYQPEFCYEHKRENWYGCRHPLDYWKGNLTIHGLWPENNDGSWPSFCSNEKFNGTKLINDIGLDNLDKIWPNVKSKPSDTKEYTDFWSHEWTKHGTCSGLSLDGYFNESIHHYLVTPSLVYEGYGKSISKQSIIDAYNGKEYGPVVTVCQHGKYLSEIRGCLSRTASTDGSPNKRIPCPDIVLKEDNCNDEIHLAIFPSDYDNNDGYYNNIIRDNL